MASQIRDRLEELRAERSENYSEFARIGQLPRPQYNSWRNSGVVPGGFYLKLIGERFAVTTDWLLGIPGAPKYLDQRRDDAQLADDLAEHLARQIARRLSRRWSHVVARMFAVDAEKVVLLGLEAVLGRLEAVCEAIERFYGSSLDAPTRWDEVTQRLADRGASSRTRYDRHAFAAEIVALRLADAARRADELFQGLPARIRSVHLDEFLAPFEEQGRARLRRGALKLARADSRILLAMIPPTRATYQRPDDRVPVGRATKPKGIGSKTSPQE